MSGRAPDTDNVSAAEVRHDQTEAEAQLYPSLLGSQPLRDHRADALGCEDLEQETVLYPAVENVGLRDARSSR